MENNSNTNRNRKRLGWAFLSIVYFGVIGLLPDLDHWICGITQKISLWDTQGCKPFHPYLLSLVIVWGIFGLALGLGWVSTVVLHPTKRTTEHYN